MADTRVGHYRALGQETFVNKAPLFVREGLLTERPKGD
jgi:hypothetical protein